MGNILAPSGKSLYDAIAEGDAVSAVEVVQTHPELIRKRLGSKKRTLYHFCAASGQVTVLRALCEHVWRTAPDEGGVVAGSHWSANRQHPAIIQYINVSDQKGFTPLSLACKKGHVQVVTFLLSQGADPWVRDRLMGRTALHHAARANHPECIEAVLSNPLVQQMGGNGSSRGKLVDCASNSGYTPLHYAAASHSHEAALALLNRGANLLAKTWEVGFEFMQLDRGSTPLHAAGRYQSLDVAMLLLKHWDEVLRRRDVPDPRVVENNARIRPCQQPSVKLNRSLYRVLDPDTPILEISDPFGESRAWGGGAGNLVQQQKQQQQKQQAKAPAGAGGVAQRSSMGYTRQDSELSRELSCTGSGGAEDLGLGVGVGLGDAGIGEIKAADNLSPLAVQRRPASSGAALQGLAAGPRQSSPDPAGPSGRSNGLGATPVADRSGRRLGFMGADRPPASPFSPKTLLQTASATVGPASLAPDPLDSAPTLEQPPRAADWQPSGSRKAASQSLPASILGSITNSLAPAAPAGPMGRSRSGASILPLPLQSARSTCPSPSPGAPPGPSQQLPRTRSLQASAPAPGPPPVGSLGRPFGSEGQPQDGRPQSEQRPVLHPPASLLQQQQSSGLGTYDADCEAPVWSPPAASRVGAAGCAMSATEAASLGFSDAPLFQPAGRQQQYPHPHQQQASSLSARSQTAREAGALSGSGMAQLQPAEGSSGSEGSPRWPQGQTQTPGPEGGEQYPPQQPTSASRRSPSGAKSLARSLSRKLSSLAAQAGGARDAVRACSPDRSGSARSGGRGGGGGGIGDGGCPPGPGADAAPLSVRGWSKQGSLGGKVPAPSVRLAF